MKKRIFLSLALMLTTFVSMWAEDVSYSWYKMIDTNISVSLERVNETASNPIVLTSTLLESSNEDNLDSGWYVLDSSFEYGERIVISGDVHLILKDGCTLTARKGIRINTDATLTIYAQKQVGDGMGKIVAQISEHDKAAIGGNKNYEAGRLYIHGGVIEATCTHENTTYTFSDTQKKVLSYNLPLGEEDNTTALTTYNGRSMNVTFTGRTLYKDGSWNTLCLPFYVDDISGSPLAGATVKELTDASFADGTLKLTFDDAASIKAGQAYLVKWDSGADLGPSDLIFSGVTLANYLSDDEISVDDSGTAAITFMGTYKKQTLAAGDRTVFYIGSDNTLYYPQSAVSIGAQRVYFKLSGLTVDEFSAGINSLTLDFGDEETTGIINLTPSLSSMGEGSADWYTLDGRRLSGKPAQKGIYINNGKKVVNK